MGKSEVRTYYLTCFIFPEFVYMIDTLPMFHYTANKSSDGTDTEAFDEDIA